MFGHLAVRVMPWDLWLVPWDLWLVPWDLWLVLCFI